MLCAVQAVGRKKRGKGRQEIDIHLLKPNKFRAESMERHLPEENLVYDEALDPSEEYVTYPRAIQNRSSNIALFAHEAGTVLWRQFSERATYSKKER